MTDNDAEKTFTVKLSRSVNEMLLALKNAIQQAQLGGFVSSRVATAG